jgi:hypothetical protein
VGATFDEATAIKMIKLIDSFLSPFTGWREETPLVDCEGHQAHPDRLFTVTYGPLGGEDILRAFTCAECAQQYEYTVKNSFSKVRVTEFVPNKIYSSHLWFSPNSETGVSFEPVVRAQVLDLGGEV